MDFITAAAEHLPAIWDITLDAKRQLRGLGIDQWQKGYPALSDWQGDVAAGRVTLAVEDGRVLGAYIYRAEPDPSYAVIDGRWLTDGPYAAIHRVCVAEKAKGKGVAGAMLGECRRRAAAEGVPALRIDTHEGNRPMRRTLEKAGFTCCGVVRLVGGCEDGQLRVAYELLVHTGK